MPSTWKTVTEGGRTRHILVPYSHDIDSGQLHDILQWQDEKTRDELKKMPPLPQRKHTKEEVGKALNEYTKWKRNKEGNVNKKYY